jgi:O-antigen ligase
MTTLECNLRRGLIAILGVVAVMGAAGITEAHVFHQASTLKYAVTIVGPLVLVALLLVGSPLALLTTVLIVAAPFAGFAMTLQGEHVPLLAPIILCAGIAAGFSKGRLTHRSALFSASVLFLLLLIVGVVESPAVTDVVATLTSLLAAAYFASRLARTEGGLVTLAWAFLASAVIQAAITVWESKTGHRLNLYGTAGSQTFGPGYFFNYGNARVRPPGAFYDPDSLGNVLAIALPLGVGLLIHYVTRRRWREVVIAGVGLTFVVIALEITLSRMSWIGATVGLIVILALVPQVGRRVLPLLAIIAIALVGIGVFGGQSTTIERLDSITHPLNETGTGNGDVIRVAAWRSALSIAGQHLLTGVGLQNVANLTAEKFQLGGTSAQGGNAQSVYLQLLAEGGVPALCGLIVVLLALRRDLVRVIRADRIWGAALAGACAAMLLVWLTDVTIRYSGVAVLMGVLFGMVAGRSGSAQEAP